MALRMSITNRIIGNLEFNFTFEKLNFLKVMYIFSKYALVLTNAIKYLFSAIALQLFIYLILF